jgi:dipeptidyl aminopeptidase/acylaminoacyl peptidase
VGAILLGLFLVLQLVVRRAHLWQIVPAWHPAADGGPAWHAVAPVGTLDAGTAPGGVVLAARDGRAWLVPAAGPPRARPLATRAVDQLLPGGVWVRARLARVGGSWRLVEVAGAQAWVSPDGRAAALYDRRQQSLWAILATDVRPRPLGEADPRAPGALVWSAGGDRLAYLSGRRGTLWSWRVGTYAVAVPGARGRPLAVRSDGALLLADAAGAPALYLPAAGATVPVAQGRVVSASPGGDYAVVAYAGRTYLTDLEDGRAAALPLRAGDVAQAVWGADGSVALLRRSRAGRPPGVLLASLSGTARPLTLPGRPVALVALEGDRLLCVLRRAGTVRTYAGTVRAGTA